MYAALLSSLVATAKTHLVTKKEKKTLSNHSFTIRQVLCQQKQKKHLEWIGSQPLH